MHAGFHVNQKNQTILCQGGLPSTPGLRLMQIHIEQNSTSAKFQKSPNIHLVRPIIHLVRMFALSD